MTTRIEAELDTRNAYIMFIKVKAYAECFPVQLKFNFDAYHVHASLSEEKSSVRVIVPKNLRDDEPKPTATCACGGN